MLRRLNIQMITTSEQTKGTCDDDFAVLWKQMPSETLNNTLYLQTYKGIHIVFTYRMLNCLCLQAVTLTWQFFSLLARERISKIIGVLLGLSW